MGSQTHVDASHGGSARKHLDILLTRPSGTRVGTLPVVRETEGPGGLCHITAVGTRDGVHIWVDTFVVVGAWAWVGKTVSSTHGLRSVDTVEVQVEAEFLVRVLAVDKLGVLDHGRVGTLVRLGCSTTKQVFTAVKRTGGCSDGRRGRVNTAN